MPPSAACKPWARGMRAPITIAAGGVCTPNGAREETYGLCLQGPWIGPLRSSTPSQQHMAMMAQSSQLFAPDQRANTAHTGRAQWVRKASDRALSN